MGVFGRIFSTIYQLGLFLLKAIFFLVVFIALLPLLPNIPPNFKFTSSPAPELAVLDGKYSVNTLLNSAERLFEGEIIGPEGFAIFNGELYTTLHGGHVAKFVGSKIQPVVKFGQACQGLAEEAKCGRPLGIFAGPDDLLYIVDAYYGVFTYDAETGKKERLFGPETQIDGQNAKLPNSITVASDGTIYWTLSSSDVTLEDGLFSMLADGSGKLIRYDRKTKTHKVLIDNLLFANGVALSPDETFVIVAETGLSRIHRHWIKGPKAGQSDIFIERLPGLPDNLRAGSDGFLASLVLAADVNTPALTQSILPLPYIRKAIARALAVSELAVDSIEAYFPNFRKIARHFIGHFEMTKPLASPRVTLVVLDLNGKVVDTFHGTDGSVAGVSDAIVYRGALYLGSPWSQYLGRVKNPDVVARFQKAFPVAPQFSVRTKSSDPTAAKPTTTPNPTTTTQKPTSTTTPKPTTTTPRPTTTTTAKPTTTTTARPTTTPKATTTTTPRPTTTPKPATTTTPRPTTTTPKPTTTQKPTTTPRPPSKKATKENAPKQGRDGNEL